MFEIFLYEDDTLKTLPNGDCWTCLNSRYFPYLTEKFRPFMDGCLLKIELDNVILLAPDNYKSVELVGYYFKDNHFKKYYLKHYCGYKNKL